MVNMRTRKKPRFLAVDFYCGAGGTTRGLLDAGGYVIAGIDNDATCQKTYERNNRNATLDGSGASFLAYDMFPETRDYPHGQQEQVFEALSELIPAKRGLASDVPLMFAICAPCQAFTKFAQRHLTPGRTESRERDRSLLAQTLRFIDEFEPELVLCENVTGISRGTSRQIWTDFIAALQERGYTVDDKEVCASHFGVPQYRRRAFLMGLKADSPVLAAPVAVPTRAGDGKPISVKEAIGDLPELEAGESSGKVRDHVCRNLSDINIRRLEYLKPGQPNFDLADAPSGDLSLACHRRLEGTGKRGFGDVYTRMQPDRPSPTITTRFVSVSNGRFGHFDQKQVRGISVREGATLQSFPRNYRFYGSGIDAKAKMIGNAVPPKLAKHMASHLVSTWESRPETVVASD